MSLHLSFARPSVHQFVSTEFQLDDLLEYLLILVFLKLFMYVGYGNISLVTTMSKFRCMWFAPYCVFKADVVSVQFEIF